MPAFLNTADPGFEAGFAAMLAAKGEDASDVGDAVAASIADVRARADVWRIRGVQSIAALACGTANIAQVDKITGPGNAYVAVAKRRTRRRSSGVAIPCHRRLPLPRRSSASTPLPSRAG